MGNNANEPTIEQIKQSLDIVTVAEMYGELVKTGVNYKYKNNSSIVISPAKQIFSDYGSGDIKGGSVLDLVMFMENLDKAKGIQKLKDLSSLDTYTVDPALQVKRKEEAKKTKTVDLKKLDYFASLEKKAISSFLPIRHTKDDELLYISIPKEFQKLFETDRLEADFDKKIYYIFNNLLGWNKHFRCPSIILNDTAGAVVDIIAYRPNKPENYDNWSNPKYVLKNPSRSKDFLYPFKKEVESMLHKQTDNKYLIVGEGIKNGLNALLYSTPFISLESTSNQIDEELLNYILDYHKQGYNIMTMFDGDNAGLKAFNKFKKLSKLNVNNFLDFDSGLDFVEFVRSEGK